MHPTKHSSSTTQPTITTSDSTTSLATQTRRLTEKAAQAIAVLPSNLSELRLKAKTQKNPELAKATMQNQEEQVQLLEAFKTKMDTD